MIEKLFFVGGMFLCLLGWVLAIACGGAGLVLLAYALANSFFPFIGGIILLMASYFGGRWLYPF